MHRNEIDEVKTTPGFKENEPQSTRTRWSDLEDYAARLVSWLVTDRHGGGQLEGGLVATQ